MARPIKEGMDYFPHDTDASNDEKIEALRALHGNDGYAFYFIILERIYRSNDAELDISKPAVLAALISKVGVSRERFDEILNTAFDIGCLDKESYEQDQVLTSNGIKKRAKEVDKLRNKWRKSKVNMVENLEENHVENRQLTGEIKEKESKVNKTKKNIPPISPQGDPVADNRELIGYRDVLDEYNRTCTKMPRAIDLNDSRRKAIRSRIKEHGRETITEVFTYASGSPHHNGTNERGWTADFDWLMGPKNFVKMLERARSGISPPAQTGSVVPWRPRQQAQPDPDCPACKGSGKIKVCTDSGIETTYTCDCVNRKMNQ